MGRLGGLFEMDIDYASDWELKCTWQWLCQTVREHLPEELRLPAANMLKIKKTGKVVQRASNQSFDNAQLIMAAAWPNHPDCTSRTALHLAEEVHGSGAGLVNAVFKKYSRIEDQYVPLRQVQRTLQEGQACEAYRASEQAWKDGVVAETRRVNGGFDLKVHYQNLNKKSDEWFGADQVNSFKF
jgi:hypothetical protein